MRCSNQTGHVVSLQLHSENTDNYGNPIPLVGQIGRSLLTLEHLEYLDLSMNNLEGSTGRIPVFLGHLKNLKYLNLSFIQFSGSLPPQLGNLTNLQYLDLSSIGVTSSTDMAWITHLRFLRYLNLDGVNLTTIDDWPLVVNMLPSLRVLRLSGCSLLNANQSLPRLNLSNLEELDLSYNTFNHPAASCWFWNVTQLKLLNIEATGLYGRFPDVLGEMMSLQILDISYYVGTSKGIMIPDLKNLCSLEIIDLSSSLLYRDATELFEHLPHCSTNKLQELHLSDNSIHGVLPNTIGQLTSLTVVELNINNITGPVPASIGNLTSLRTLNLAQNHFTGQVPYEIGMLTDLIFLDMDDNDLDGVITEEHFHDLKSLQYIDLSSNSLKIQINENWQPPFRLQSAVFATCQMGPLFPAWLQWMVGIRELVMSNTGLNDTIPHWFSSAFSNAYRLDISENQLSGGLPPNMETMSVEELDFNSNLLTGQIPPFPPKLTYLDLSMNTLSGPLPTKFGVPNLQELSLFSNLITGRISQTICSSEGLRVMDIANNHFEGELPVCLGNTQLTSLVLSNNSFSGKFPSFVKNCTNLQILDLAGNMFAGRLPEWIGSFMGLIFLRLSHNTFSGNIPNNVTSLECLRYLDVADNVLSGSLPRLFSNLKALRQKYRFCNYYGELHSASFSAVTKGQQLNYGSINQIISMRIIDFSSNNLTGDIPEEIATLDELVSLNLSRNYFTGNVPSLIGNIQSLESLDLSRNELSGEKPVSLSNLTFLSYLDLSYNNLEGRIPSGSQLDTLYAANPYMYTGNIDLCGPPLKDNCSSTDASKQGQSTRTERSSGPEIFYIGLGCGFVTGIWVAFFALLFIKRWRIAYFHHLDEVYDKAYVLLAVTWARLTRKTTAI